MELPDLANKDASECPTPWKESAYRLPLPDPGEETEWHCVAVRSHALQGCDLSP